MAQQASPKVMGHMLDSRAQLIACSSVVVTTFSSNRPSSHPMYFVLSRSAVCSQHVTSRSTAPASFTGSLGKPRRRGRRQALARRAADPIQVAAFPKVGEANQEHAEENHDVPEGEPCESPGGVPLILASLRGCGPRAAPAEQARPVRSRERARSPLPVHWRGRKRRPRGRRTRPPRRR